MEQLAIEGAFLMSLDRAADNRGYMERLFEEGCFANGDPPNVSFVHNPTKGTLRGLHFQREPFAETKMVYCVSGKLFDVLVDARDNSPTKRKVVTIELTAGDGKMICIPKGVAHGYLTLEDNTSLIYFTDTPYSPEHADGLRWDDKWLNIKWPFKPTLVSTQDSKWRDCAMRYLWLADPFSVNPKA